VLGLVTKPYTVKDICRVLRYERSKIPIFALRNKRTFPNISLGASNEIFLTKKTSSVNVRKFRTREVGGGCRDFF
jgi:hypothetical protein